MTMWRGRGNTVIYGLIAVLTIISLLTLFRLRNQFAANQEKRINDLERVFSNRNLIKMPTDPKIVFYEIEAEVAKYENRGEFGAIWISKNFGNTERVVYPFYYPALKADERQAMQQSGDSSEDSWLQRRFPSEKLVERSLESDGEHLGTLFVRVDQSALRTVSLVIWALGAMLATSLAFLATQFRRQEKVISATTIELEEKRRELVRLERLALAGQLSANILHDLKKPVLNIRNEAEEWLNPLGPSEPADPANIFTRIREQADFFLSMLKEAGFDRFVRAHEVQEYVDINDLLDRSLALVRYERASIEVVYEYGPDLPPVLADPVRIIQIFSNIVLNAYQALQGRGRLLLSTRRDGDKIVVEIRDNGPGISPEKLENVFEPFYTTKEPGEGTGLGLYIVREILYDMDATIKVESKPGDTVFTLSFAYEL